MSSCPRGRLCHDQGVAAARQPIVSSHTNDSIMNIPKSLASFGFRDCHIATGCRARTPRHDFPAQTCLGWCGLEAGELPGDAREPIEVLAEEGGEQLRSTSCEHPRRDATVTGDQ
jgi:hypothetical protein